MFATNRSALRLLFALVLYLSLFCFFSSLFSFLFLFLFSAMALGGGTPVDGLDGAVVRHVVVLERQQVGHDPALGVVWGESFFFLLQTLH